MRIIVAPDSFKDALRASAACLHIAAGIRRAVPDAVIDLCPIADGGEGFTQAITFGRANAASRVTPATDPLGRPIDAGWSVLHDGSGRVESAVIELAAASGLERLGPEERDATRTTTFGTGVLIQNAISEGASGVLLGIGGSATNDGGCGIAQAMGVRFFDRQGRLIKTPMVGGMLCGISRIDLGTRRRGSGDMVPRIRVACDVTNPLTGPNGAAHVYGPQKGADSAAVEILDDGLKHLARLWREQLGADVEYMPGAGAAGGVGGGLVAMLGAELVSGADLVLDSVGFDGRVNGCDLCITGEGRLDGQSVQGKAAITVAQRARRAGVRCVALVGCVGEGVQACLEQGLSAYRVIGEGLEPAESIRRTGELLERAAEEAVRDRWG